MEKSGFFFKEYFNHENFQSRNATTDIRWPKTKMQNRIKSTLMQVSDRFHKSHFQALKKAAEAIKNATAIVLTSGAGLGVDSGLPDFR